MGTNLPLFLAGGVGILFFLLLLGRKSETTTTRVTTRIPAPPANIRQALQQASDRTGVPVSLLIAVAYTESRYNPNVTSGAGAQGLMQLMPSVQQSHGVTDPFNPYQSALAGAKMLRNLFSKYGNWDQALAAYNWGPGNVDRKPLASQWPTSVQNYVTKISGTRVA